LHYDFLEEATSDIFIVVANWEDCDAIELNVLEQFTAILFLALTPSALKEYLPSDTLKALGPGALLHGANIRMPLAQGINYADEPDITWLVSLSTNTRISPSFSTSPSKETLFAN
jgi:hypothetical protein